MNEEVKSPEQQAAQPQSELKVSDWVKRFSAAEKIMKDEFLPKYQLAKQRLRAEHEIKGKGTRKLTHEQVNLVYSIGQNFVNSVYFKAPDCNLTAREEVDHMRVENTEIATNDWLKDNKAKKVVKRVIWDAYLGGLGAAFIDYEYDDMEDEENIISPAGIDPATGQPTPPKFGRLVLKNEITIQRIRPDLLRFPKGFDLDNYQDSPWIGFDLIIPIEEIKNNTQWDEEIRNKIEGESFEKLSYFERKTNTKPDDGTSLYGKISFCFKRPQYPKIQPLKLLVFSSKNQEKYLLETEFKKGNVGYPVKFLFFNPLDDDCSYPNGDPWNFESQSNAVDEWWKKVVNHVRRSNPKMAYDSGAISTQEANKLKSNNDNELVGLSNKERRDLSTLIRELNAPQLNPDLDKLWQSARELLSQIAPRTSISDGGKSAGSTATEAKIEQAGEVIDVDARIDDVRDFIRDIILDVAGILETSLAAPMSLKRENPDGSSSFSQVGSDGFTSKIEIDVDVESMQSQNKDVIRRQLIDAIGLFQNLDPFFQAARIAPDPKFWIERLMETMHIRNIDKGFIPLTPQPMVPSVAPVSNQTEPNTTIGGQMPPEAVEAGLAQRT